LFNSFGKNRKLTVDTFEDGIVYFWDSKITADSGIYVFRKPTHTGQYTLHYDSFEPQARKATWIKSLFTVLYRFAAIQCAFRNKQIAQITKFILEVGMVLMKIPNLVYSDPQVK
jgi:hypothetical protein